MMRICKTCGVAKPLTDYTPSKASRDGHVLHCKPCMIIRVRASEMRHPETKAKYRNEPQVRSKIAVYRKKWERGPASKAARHKQYLARRDKMRTDPQYRAMTKAYNQAYYLAHRDQWKERRRTPQYNAYQQAYYLAHREQILARQKAKRDASKQPPTGAHMCNVINLPTAAADSQPVLNFKALQIPPGVWRWISDHPPDSNLVILSDPVTGRFAGAVRRDVLSAYVAEQLKGAQ